MSWTCRVNVQIFCVPYLNVNRRGRYVRRRLLRAGFHLFIYINWMIFVIGKETKLGSVQEVHANGSAESVETECLLGDQAECTNKPEIQSAVGLAVDISQSKNVDTEFRSLAFGSATSIRSTGHRHMVNARTVLWYLSFFGFAINYMLRMNINIAITEMITTNASDKTSAPSECIVDRFANGTTKIDLGNVSNSMIKAISAPSPSYTTEQRMLDYFGVSCVLLTIQGVLLIISSAFSSIFHQQGITGTKHKRIKFSVRIIGSIGRRKYWEVYSPNVMAQNSSLAAPIWLFPCYRWPYRLPRTGTWMHWLHFAYCKGGSRYVFFFLNYFSHRKRNASHVISFIWLVQGLQWPSMHNLAAHWIPPDERSRFVTSYLGSSVGLAIFSPLFGYIIGTWSWQWVFYVSGIVGSVWYIGWVIFVFDTPAQHPRIHPLERQYIEKSLEGIVHNDRKGSVPWKSIFLSPPLWANLFAQWGCVWGEDGISIGEPWEYNLEFCLLLLNCSRDHADDTNAIIFPYNSRLEYGVGWMAVWRSASATNDFCIFLLAIRRLDIASEQNVTKKCSQIGCMPMHCR